MYIYKYIWRASESSTPWPYRYIGLFSEYIGLLSEYMGLFSEYVGLSSECIGLFSEHRGLFSEYIKSICILWPLGPIVDCRCRKLLLHPWYMHVCMCVRYVCGYVRRYIRMYVCKCVCMYVCAHACRIGQIVDCCCWRARASKRERETEKKRESVYECMLTAAVESSCQKERER